MLWVMRGVACGIDAATSLTQRLGQLNDACNIWTVWELGWVGRRLG
jgi:hypothetical protein